MNAILLASVVALTNVHGRVEIDTLGARVTSYVPAGGAETLARLPSGAGGIPLCWPWFQYNGPKGEDSPKHGVVRDRDFEVVEAKNGTSSSEASLRLLSDEATRRLFPHDFALTLRVRLDEMLHLELTAENTGTEAFSVTEAFHPYIRREALPLLADRGNGSFRTWDPDASSHLKTQGLGPDDWRTFVCVENGTFERERAYRLAPGERHQLKRAIGPKALVMKDDPGPLEPR